MRREVLWTPWDAPGLEHMQLDSDEKTISADGAIIGVFDGAGFRASYQIMYDAASRVREVRVTTSQPVVNALYLHMDNEGRWSSDTGELLSALNGCSDVDFAATPFTNTPPIRRLDLHQEESAEIAVVYIDSPSLAVTSVWQRYTCLSRDSDGGRYRFEALPYPALPEGFVAELSVDADGLVCDYPPLFRRVWSGEL
jgi:hypothetical protein